MKDVVPPVDGDLLVRLCDDASDEMLTHLEDVFAELDPAAAATAVVMLAGKLQGRHGGDGLDADRALDLWAKSWRSPGVAKVFKEGIALERLRRAVPAGKN